MISSYTGRACRKLFLSVGQSKKKKRSEGVNVMSVLLQYKAKTEAYISKKKVVNEH